MGYSPAATPPDSKGPRQNPNTCMCRQVYTGTPKRMKATMIFAGLVAIDLENFGCGLKDGHTFRICATCSTAVLEAHRHAILPEHGSQSPSLHASGGKLSVPSHLILTTRPAVYLSSTHMGTLWCVPRTCTHTATLSLMPNSPTTDSGHLKAGKS